MDAGALRGPPAVSPTGVPRPRTAAGTRPVGTRSGAAVLALLAALAAIPAPPAPPLAAQTPPAAAPGRPDQRDGLLVRLDQRLGFLVTSGEGFGDRPVWEVAVGLQRRAARPGSGPALGLTLGAGVGAAEFLGPTHASFRVMAGIEGTWSLSPVIELVPSFQAGYLEALEEDGRRGLVTRTGVGLRVLIPDRAFYFGFEPISLVTLPRARPSLPTDGGSRFAPELGILRFGWRF